MQKQWRGKVLAEGGPELSSALNRGEVNPALGAEHSSRISTHRAWQEMEPTHDPGLVSAQIFVISTLPAPAGHLCCCPPPAMCDLHQSSCWELLMHLDTEKKSQLSKRFYVGFFFFCLTLNSCCVPLLLYLVDVPCLCIFLFLLFSVDPMESFVNHKYTLNALVLSSMEQFLSKAPLYCV